MDQSNQAGAIHYIDLQEAARILGFHWETVREWAVKGDLKGYLIGNRWRFTEQDIHEWMEAHSNQKPDQPSETE